eukprot:6492030-Amphidinium_carterae.1
MVSYVMWVGVEWMLSCVAGSRPCNKSCCGCVVVVEFGSGSCVVRALWSLCVTCPPDSLRSWPGLDHRPLFKGAICASVPQSGCVLAFSWWSPAMLVAPCAALFEGAARTSCWACCCWLVHAQARSPSGPRSVRHFLGQSCHAWVWSNVCATWRCCSVDGWSPWRWSGSSAQQSRADGYSKLFFLCSGG